MRLAAALSLLLLAPVRAGADPLCAGAIVTAGGEAYDAAPFCTDVPAVTRCRVESVELVGTRVSVTVVACLPT